ncbi:hypothetical protein [Glycomyces rhizosphaerae]|uniref:Uncharacterized protein n=1 Tax=Glycomyces rhizosphaerae TaxID=2054422 RepID=A0ABV7PWH4_9ACTN
MNTYELQREHLVALITGDLEGAARLRARLGRDGEMPATEFMRAATAVCLEYRFGPGAGLGAGPIDYDELAAFMAELRRSGRTAEPPPDYLAVEAVVRSLYGETHLIEPLEKRQRSQAIFTALQHQVHRHPWIAANAAWVAERAKQTWSIWLLGRPT